MDDMLKIISNDTNNQVIKTAPNLDTVIGAVYKALLDAKKTGASIKIIYDYNVNIIKDIIDTYNQQIDYLLDTYNQCIYAVHLDGLQVVLLSDLDINDIKSNNYDIYDIVTSNSSIDIPIYNNKSYWDIKLTTHN